MYGVASVWLRGGGRLALWLGYNLQAPPLLVLLPLDPGD